MIRVYFEGNSLPNCCGAIELGAFRTGDDLPDWLDTVFAGNTEKDAWTKALKSVFEEEYDVFDRGGEEERAYECAEYLMRYIQFWFVRQEDNDDFDNDVLRQLVMNLPGVTKLAGYVNPNSGNYIEGYGIFNDGTIVVPT